MFAVIFDMDGVLVDNSQAHAQAFQALMRKHGRDMSYEEYQSRISGRSNPEIFRDLFPDQDGGARRALADEKEALYRELYAPDIRPVAGLVELLDALKREGAVLGLATSAPPENVAFTLAQTRTRPYFQEVLTMDHVTERKPHPEVYLKMAEKLGVPPERCVVFEDSLPGIEAAHRAGMKVVGVCTSHLPSELAHADRVVRDFTEVTVEQLRALVE